MTIQVLSFGEDLGEAKGFLSAFVERRQVMHHELI